jgi:hypothetical protein
MSDEEIWEKGDKIELSRYKISTHGKVKSIRYDKNMAFMKDDKGYESIKLRKDDGTYKRYQVHRLVAMLFIPQVVGKDTVDHMDQNPSNNKVSNLSWADRKDQANNRTYPKEVAKLQYKICQLDSDGKNLIKVWDSAKSVAEHFGVSYTNICHICNAGKKFREFQLIYEHKYVDFSIEGEAWTKVLVDTKNDYFISDYGRLKNHKNIHLSGTISNNGYMMFSLTLDTNKDKYIIAHGLVAEAFLGPRPEGKVINHKNGIKTDNRVANLEYITQKENVEHAHANGLIKKRFDSKEVIKLTVDGEKELARYGSPMDAARSISPDKGTTCISYHIAQCCRGEQKTAYDHKWKYA